MASMIFLPYTPRDGALADGYEDWLRDVDNPFFNSRPAVSHYTNWKVSAAVAGDVWFSHFDFLVYEGSAEAVWSDPPLADFAARWVQRWGKEPSNPDVSVNYHAYNCSGGTLWQSLGGQVTLAYDAQGGEAWDITGGVVGAPIARRLSVIMQSVGDAPSSLNAQILATGTLVAGP